MNYKRNSKKRVCTWIRQRITSRKSFIIFVRALTTLSSSIYTHLFWWIYKNFRIQTMWLYSAKSKAVQWFGPCLRLVYTIVFIVFHEVLSFIQNRMKKTILFHKSFNGRFERRWEFWRFRVTNRAQPFSGNCLIQSHSMIYVCITLYWIQCWKFSRKKLFFSLINLSRKRN